MEATQDTMNGVLRDPPERPEERVVGLALMNDKSSAVAVTSENHTAAFNVSEFAAFVDRLRAFLNTARSPQTDGFAHRTFARVCVDDNTPGS